MSEVKQEIESTTETTTTTAPVQSEYILALNMIIGSIAAAAKIKGGLTMQDCRQIKDARDILVDYFTLEEGDVELSEPSRIETDSLAILIKILETQQLTGVFSIEGSIEILDAIEKLSDAMTDKKSVTQKMEEARRRLKNKGRK